MKIKSLIIEIIVVLYASLFIYTAISKLGDYDMSREQMATMPLVGYFSGIIVWALPVTEIVLALMIFWPKTRVKGLYLGTGLMLAFTIYVWYLMKFHNGSPCTCGGLLQSLTWPVHLVFNGVFVVLGVIALLLEANKYKAVEKKKIAYHH